MSDDNQDTISTLQKRIIDLKDDDRIDREKKSRRAERQRDSAARKRKSDQSHADYLKRQEERSAGTDK